jgi:hypothetical protein
MSSSSSSSIACLLLRRWWWCWSWYLCECIRTSCLWECIVCECCRCECIHTYISSLRVRTHTNNERQTHKHKHTRKHVHLHTHTHTYAHTHIRTHTLTHIHTYVHRFTGGRRATGSRFWIKHESAEYGCRWWPTTCTAHGAQPRGPAHDVRAPVYQGVYPYTPHMCVYTNSIDSCTNNAVINRDGFINISECLKTILVKGGV